MSKAEYRALVIRSEALNQKYHLGRWQGVPQGMTPSEYRALVIRGEALNKQYGLGKWSKARDAVGEPLERVLLGSLRNRCGSDARARTGRNRRDRGQPPAPQRSERPNLIAALAGTHRPRLP